MKKNLFILLLIITVISNGFSQDKSKSEIPKNVKLIAVNCSGYWFFQTVIDLDNNEIVNLCYVCNTASTVELKKVIRTGMIVDPKDYVKISLTSNPFVKN
jgi:hypothetical protein